MRKWPEELEGFFCQSRHVRGEDSCRLARVVFFAEWGRMAFGLVFSAKEKPFSFTFFRYGGGDVEHPLATAPGGLEFNWFHARMVPLLPLFSRII